MRLLSRWPRPLERRHRRRPSPLQPMAALNRLPHLARPGPPSSPSPRAQIEDCSCASMANRHGYNRQLGSIPSHRRMGGIIYHSSPTGHLWGAAWMATEETRVSSSGTLTVPLHPCGSRDSGRCCSSRGPRGTAAGWTRPTEGFSSRRLRHPARGSQQLDRRVTTTRPPSSRGRRRCSLPWARTLSLATRSHSPWPSRIRRAIPSGADERSSTG